MRCVVFGGAGFLGSYVVDALLAEGYDAFSFDRRESPHIAADRSIVGDILDPDAVGAAVEGATHVFNFAGLADIDECMQRPIDAVRLNVLGNTVILDAATKARVDRFLFASSLYVYSETGGIYRSTKQACESIIEDYARYHDLRFTILRYGTPYGPRADDRNSVHRFLVQALQGAVEYQGSGEEIREYIHAADAARLSLAALDKSYENERVILSGLHPVKVSDLLTMISEILGGKVEIRYLNQPGDTHYRTTAYSYNPKIARKIVAPSYLDLGQGLLQYIEQLAGTQDGR